MSDGGSRRRGVSGSRPLRLSALWALGGSPPAPANAGVRYSSSLTLKVRATDGSDSIHTAQAAHVLPDSASGYHAIHGILL